METMHIWQHREPHEDDYYRFVYFIPIKHPDGNYVLVGSSDDDYCKTNPQEAVGRTNRESVDEARLQWDGVKTRGRYFLMGTQTVDA